MKKKFSLLVLMFTLILTLSFVPAAFASDTVITVNPTNSKVFVDSEEKSFEAYNIDDYNFFKLRDLAFVLNGTSKQFEVSYNDLTQEISLSKGRLYTAVGGEMLQGDGQPKEAIQTQSKININGKEEGFTAYNIDGYNYIKLRDLMKAMNIGVVYDDETQNIGIITTLPYTD